MVAADYHAVAAVKLLNSSFHTRQVTFTIIKMPTAQLR
jgi:hypothetical protein